MEFCQHWLVAKAAGTGKIPSCPTVTRQYHRAQHKRTKVQGYTGVITTCLITVVCMESGAPKGEAKQVHMPYFPR